MQSLTTKQAYLDGFKTLETTPEVAGVTHHMFDAPSVIFDCPSLPCLRAGPPAAPWLRGDAQQVTDRWRC